MPDGFFFKDPGEARTPFNDNYVVMGIVGVCVLWPLSYLARECSMESERTPRSPALPRSRILKHRLSRSQAPKHRRQAKLEHHNWSTREAPGSEN